MAETQTPAPTGVITHRCGDPSAATDEQLLEVIYLQQRDSGNASPEIREYLYRTLGRIF